LLCISEHILNSSSTPINKFWFNDLTQADNSVK
jgi:hypothetical protein